MTEKEMKKLAEQLNLLQSSENWGNGVNCVKSIVWYLNHCYYDKACAVANNEWDKISSYNKISKLLIQKGLFTPIN